MILLKFLTSIFKRSAVVGMLISILSGVANTLLLALITRRLMGMENGSSNFLLLLGGLFLMAVFLDLLAKWLLMRLTARTTNNLRLSLAAQILQKPLESIETIGAPRLQALLTEDIQTVGQIVGNLPTMVVAVATSVGCIFYLGWLSPTTLLIFLLAAIPAIIGHRLLQQRAMSLIKESLVVRNRLFQHYHSLVEGIKELMLHAPRQQTFLQQVLNTSVDELLQKSTAARMWLYAAQSWSQSIYFLFIIVIFVLAAQSPFDTGFVATYAIIVLYLRGSLLTVLQMAATWSSADVTLQQIELLGFRILAQPLERAVVRLPNRSATVKIELRKLTYHYRRENDENLFTLGPLTFSLQSGELVFIVGGNGSGKTTLVKLLAGLYTPHAGEIICNGNRVRTEELASYRQNVSVIFADFFLFDQLLGIEEWQIDERAGHYLAQLQLDNKVEINGNRLSTTKLSYGQRKRLALLTAYLEDRPVYIFDEWAASQDPEFREVFYRQLLPELKQRGKLVIVISHDDHYFDVADRVIKLDFGKIIEE